jgi:hypothetical protein
MGGIVMETKQIAQACLDAMKIHEDSWFAAKNIYTKDEMVCCTEACEKNGVDTDLAELMYLARYSWPNDVDFWAESILRKIK